MRTAIGAYAIELTKIDIKVLTIQAVQMRSKHTFWDLSSPSIMADILRDFLSPVEKI